MDPERKTTNPKSKKPTVFIVEDDPFVLRVYQRKLSLEGFEISLATNGEEALRRISLAIPDLILLDLVMPQKDGFELIADLKDDPKLKTVPIVVLTNLRQESDKQRAQSFGVDAYIVKSETSINDVVTKIKEVIASAKKNE
ncbi:MAG TPA: response regulator [Candidatus Paceibacterota bacterium]